MKKNYCFKRIYIPVFIIFFAVSISSAQISRSAYFYDNLTISNTLNPSFTTSGEFFVGLPLLSSLYVGFVSPVNYSEITKKGINDEYVYLNRESIIASLDDINVLSLNVYSALGQFGIRLNKLSLQVGIAKIFSSNIFLEKELVEFLLYGNVSDEFLGKPVTLDKTSVNSTLYHEFSIGYSYELNHKFSFGSTFKYLNGAANIYTENARIDILTQNNLNYTITASTDLNLHTSSQYGYIDEISGQDLSNYLWLDFSKNHGFAFNLGLTYRPVSRLKVSVSAVDIGKISWKENVKSYKSKYPNQQYKFEGLDINDFISDNKFVDTIPLLDSISNHFKIEENNEPYTSYLTHKSYLCATYDLTKNDQIGFLLKTEYFKYITRFSYTLNYKRKLGNSLSANINYTLINKRSNFGLGIVLNAKPFNIFIMSDMLTSFFDTYNARAIYFQFGIGFVFGESGWGSQVL